MKEQEAQSQSEGGLGTNWTNLYASLRSNIPGADTASDQYVQMMVQKYPAASSCPDFDHDVWVTASSGVKKGYVKGLGFKRARASDFTSCTSTSVGGSTATSAAHTSQQSAEAMVRAICTNQNLMDRLTDALFSRMTTDQIGIYLAGRAQAQRSANTQPPPPPPSPRRDEN